MFAGTSSNNVAQDLLYPKDDEEKNVDIEEVDDALRTNIFNVMLGRRSQRKFDEARLVEEAKVEMIFAAADTAPTAGGFQGFEIFNVKKPEVKVKLVEAANKQPYVSAPVVLVFCMNPDRVRMNFHTIFSGNFHYKTPHWLQLMRSWLR